MDYAYIICYIILIVIISIYVSLLDPSSNIFFKFLILRNYKKIIFNLEYYRDILKYSPSEILFIAEKGYDNDKLNPYGIINKYKKMIYINLLKMYLLGYVNIDFSKGTNFKIIKNDISILDEEYSMIYQLIFSEITEKPMIMLSDIYNYVEDNYQKNSFFDEWDKLVKRKLFNNGFYSTDFIEKFHKIAKKYYVVASVVLLTFFIINLLSIGTSFMPGLALFSFYSIFVILGYNKIKDIKMFSNYAVYEYKKIKALKKFLRDFTIIDERPPEYVKILEDYIVYAAIFDMHDLSIGKTIEEIKLFLSVNILE